MKEVSVPYFTDKKDTLVVPVENNNFAWVCIGIIIGVVIAVGFVQLEISPQWVNDQTCDAMIENASKQSFINGSIYGASVFQDAIIKQSLQCEPIPFGFNNQTYNLVLVECLNQTKFNGGNK